MVLDAGRGAAVALPFSLAGEWDLDLDGQQCFGQPDKGQQDQDGDDAGGHQHDGQSLQKIVGHPAHLVRGSGGGMGDPVQQTCPEALLIPALRSAVLDLLGGVLGGLDGGVDGGLIGVLDHIGELEAHRDHQDDEQAEGGQLSGQEPEPPPVKEHIQDIGQAGHGDQDFEGEKAGDGQQILFQIDSAEHHKKVGAQVGQLLRDGGGGVSGNEGDGRRGRRGGGGELQHSGLLFLQCGNGVLVKFRGGRDACQDKEGEEGGEQGEDQEQGVPAKFFLDHVGLLSWEVVGSWTGQLSRAGCPHPGWEGGSRCP